MKLLACLGVISSLFGSVSPTIIEDPIISDSSTTENLNYNGFFTFDLNLDFSTLFNNRTDAKYYFLSGIYQQRLIETLVIGYNAITNCSIVSVLYLDSEHFTPVYDSTNGGWSSNERIFYISYCFSQTSYNMLGSCGHFAYIPTTTPTTNSFTDIVYALIDVPIITIQKLLNFSLFGVDLFYAFTGILTLLLIISVIKMIIAGKG